MLAFETTVETNRPIGEVFVFAIDYDTHLQWQAGTVETEVTMNGPLGTAIE